MEMRRDQVQYTLEQLERDYQSFARLGTKAWMSSGDKAEVRASLERSLGQAQEVLQRLGPAGQHSVAVQNLQSKLILWSTMAEGDLKQAPR